MKLQDILIFEIKASWHIRSRAIWIVLFLPVVYGIMFGLAYSNNVIKYVPLVIYDQDQSPASRALVQAYGDSERYRLVGEVQTQEAMEEMLRNGEALVAVSIPPGFSKNIKLGSASQVLVTVDSTNNMFSNAVITSSQEIVQTYSVATSQKLFEASNFMPAPSLRIAAPIIIGTRIINNSTTSYTNFMLPGLIMNGLQIAILLLVGTSLAPEYRRVSFWQGTSSTTIVNGKMLPCWLQALFAYIVSIGLVTWLFAIPQKSDLVSIIVLGGAFTFLLVNLCLLFSAATGDEIMAMQVPLLYIMPGLLYSGLSWPDFAMSEFAKFFSALMPLTYMADTLRDLLLSGHSPTFGKNVFLMFVAGTLLHVVTIAVFSFRRKKIQYDEMAGNAK